MTALHYAALRLQEIVLQPYAAFFCFPSNKFWLKPLVLSTWRLLDA
jgi:hypothetical protein